MAQKSYKKKIHNNVTVYQANKLPTGMKMSRIMRVIEKKIPAYYLRGVESLVIADISKLTPEEKMVEGNTIFISNEHYCEDLLIENFIISVGETLFAEVEGVKEFEDFEQEFLFKRRDLYYDLAKSYDNIAFSDFLSLEISQGFTKSIRKINFDDVIYSTQKYFVNYDSCLSLKKYFSHLFFFHLDKEIDKRKFKAFRTVMNKVRKICKEKIKNEENN